jgi:hypothetical protein
MQNICQIPSDDATMPVHNCSRLHNISELGALKKLGQIQILRSNRAILARASILDSVCKPGDIPRDIVF